MASFLLGILGEGGADGEKRVSVNCVARGRSRLNTRVSRELGAPLRGVARGWRLGVEGLVIIVGVEA